MDLVVNGPIKAHQRVGFTLGGDLVEGLDADSDDEPDSDDAPDGDSTDEDD